MSLKIGITEAGDPAFDYSWVDKISEMDMAILITKNITDEYKQQLVLRVKELMGWGVEIGEKGIQTLKEAGVSIPGLTDDESSLYLPGAHEESSVVIPVKTVSGIDDNPNDGVDFHKGASEAGSAAIIGGGLFDQEEAESVDN